MPLIPRSLELYIADGNRTEILKFLQPNYFDEKFVNRNGDTVLHLTLKNEKSTQEELIEILIIFLREGVDPNTKNDKQETVLHLAVAQQLEKVIDYLILHGAEKNVTDTKGNTITHYFINNLLEKFIKISRHYDSFHDANNLEEKESLKFVERMVSKGFDFDLKNKNGQSSLYFAIEYNLQHILPFLLKNTRDIDFVSEPQRQNFLQLFVNANNKSRTYEFIVHYYDMPTIRRKNKKIKFSPSYRVHPNVFSRQYDTEIIQILLERGLSVDHVDNQGLTALNNVVSFKVKTDTVKILLEHFTKVNDECGVKLTHNMIENMSSIFSDFDYYLDIFRTLLAKGADVNSMDEHGLTALHHAIDKRILLVIMFLKENEANFNVLTRDGQNLLHFLAHKSNEHTDMSLFDLLINEGCDVIAQDNHGQTPLHIAIKNKNNFLIKKLLDHVEVNVNCQDNEKNTPLHLASEQGCVQIIKLLLEKGAYPNSHDKDDRKPLHYTAKQGNREVAQLLVMYGSEIDSKDRFGNRPLHLAMKLGNIDMIKFLLDLGANINDKNNYGDRPLHYTAMLNRNGKLIFEKLLFSGALLDARNNNGESAFVKAIQSGCKDNINEFLKYGADINDKCVIQSLSKCCPNVAEMMVKHWIKLNTANIWCSNDYVKLPHHVDMVKKHNEFRIECLKEVQKLKKKLINEHTSLYDWLRMSSKRRCMYIKNDKMVSRVNLVEINKQFTKYSGVIFGNIREALTRKLLLAQAKEALENMNLLPDICIDCILSYLSNGDLIDFIEALARKSLLKEAKKILRKMNMVYLPDNCLDYIFSYLYSRDLINIIEMSIQD